MNSPSTERNFIEVAAAVDMPPSTEVFYSPSSLRDHRYMEEVDILRKAFNSLKEEFNAAHIKYQTNKEKEIEYINNIHNIDIHKNSGIMDIYVIIQRLDAIEASTTWKMTSIFRRVASRNVIVRKTFRLASWIFLKKAKQ